MMQLSLSVKGTFVRGLLSILFIFLCLLWAGRTESFQGDAVDPSVNEFWTHDLEDTGEKSPGGIGMASWYGGKFHGRKTASGERYNKWNFTCASPHLPFGTLLEVTNMRNGKSAVVRVNDRGPYRKKRILDLSRAAAESLGFRRSGVAQVTYKVIEAP